MIAVVSIVSVIAGTTVAWFGARHHPRHQEVLKSLGGLLLVAGFALLGYSLEHIICLP